MSEFKHLKIYPKALNWDAADMVTEWEIPIHMSYGEYEYSLTERYVCQSEDEKFYRFVSPDAAQFLSTLIPRIWAERDMIGRCKTKLIEMASQ
jgi:hypothetical protein